MDDLEWLSQDLKRATLELDTKRELDRLKKQVEEQDRGPAVQPTSSKYESYSAALKEAEIKQRAINDFLAEHEIRYAEDRDRFVSEKDKKLNDLYNRLAQLNTERKECTDGQRLRQIDDEIIPVEKAITEARELISTAQSLNLKSRPIRKADTPASEKKEEEKLPQNAKEIKELVDKSFSHWERGSYVGLHGIYEWQIKTVSQFDKSHHEYFTYEITLPADIPADIKEFKEYKDLGSLNGYTTIEVRSITRYTDTFVVPLEPDKIFTERYVRKNRKGVTEYAERKIKGVTIAKRYQTRNYLVKLGLLPPVPDTRPPELE